MKEELRFYSFCNMYISHIQAGIQTGHMSDNMSVKYLLNTTLKNNVFLEKKKVHEEWIRNHKTYIILSGGDSDEIYRINGLLNGMCHTDVLALPVGSFNEPGLNNMMSCCGVVVPERYFKAVKIKASDDSNWDYFYRYEKDDQVFVCLPDSAEFEFIELIKSKPLFK